MRRGVPVPEPARALLSLRELHIGVAHTRPEAGSISREHVSLALFLLVAAAMLLPLIQGQHVELTVVWGGEQDESGGYIARDDAGNLFVAGQSPMSPSGHSNIFLLKFTSQGNIAWRRRFQTDYSTNATALAVDREGHLLILGNIGDGLHSWVLLNVDPEGNLLWKVGWRKSLFDFKAQSLAVDASGNSLVAGFRQTEDGSGGSFLAKVDATGSLNWLRMWNGISCSAACNVAVDSENNIYLILQGMDGAAGFLVGLSSEGNAVFQREIETPWGIRALTTTPTGVAITGLLAICADDTCVGRTVGVALYYFSLDGDMIWQKSWATSNIDTLPAGLSSDYSGNIYIIGRLARAKETSTDIFLLQADSEGAILLQVGWGGEGYENPSGIIGNGERLYVAGSTNSSSHHLYSLRGQQGFLAHRLSTPSFTFESISGGLSEPDGVIAPYEPAGSSQNSYNLFLVILSLYSPTSLPPVSTPATTPTSGTSTTVPQPTVTASTPNPTDWFPTPALLPTGAAIISSAVALAATACKCRSRKRAD